MCNLASPASPPAYLARPFDTLAVGSEGTRRLLELAREHGARFLMASTSEIYGDPEVHPQVESYRGNVDPTGPRSVYDEAKRFSESLTMAMHRTHGVNVGIARIFNTYGPRLSAGDGRVVSNFIVQALRGEPLTVYGDGSQTRSLCFVDDEISGLVALLDSSLVGPVNIGQPRRALRCSSWPTSSWRSPARRRTSSSSRCRPTTRPAAAPISPWPGASWVGSPGSGSERGSSAQCEYFADREVTDDPMTERDVTDIDTAGTAAADLQDAHA